MLITRQIADREMRSLILHIGCHKTGTSSIQATLLAEKTSLQAQGWTLFHSNPDGSQRGDGSALPWVRFRPSLSTRVQGIVKRKLPEVLASAGENVIASAETFSWLFSRQQVNWLARSLKPYFDDIRIVTYIRRQDQQAVSHYQQASKQDAIISSRFYQGNYKALPIYRAHLRAYLDYHTRLSHWGDAFGDDSMRIGIFDQTRLLSGDVVADFFERLELAPPSRTIRKNESSGAQKTKMGHLVSAREFSPAVWQALMQHQNNEGKLMPSRNDALAFYQEFANANKKLNERYRLVTDGPVFSDDFGAYPQTGNDLWTETTANEAILNLLKGVEDLLTLTSTEAKTLGNASKLLSDLSPELAVQLNAILDRVSKVDASHTSLVPKWQRKVRSLVRRS